MTLFGYYHLEKLIAKLTLGKNSMKIVKKGAPETQNKI